MHPVLHTKDNMACEELVLALEACHARGFIHKALGGCTDAKHAVNMCLRVERLKRTAHNSDKARAKREKVEKAWREVDANT